MNHKILLQQVMNLFGFTRADLCQILGKDKDTISKWLSGEVNIPEGTIYRLYYHVKNTVLDQALQQKLGE